MDADLEKRARELLAEIRFRCVDSDGDWHNMEAKDVVRLHNDLEALAAALSAGQADARRYRWLVENRTTYRTGDFMNPPLCKVEFYHHAAGVIGPGPTLDAAIDAAIAASGERDE